MWRVKYCGLRKVKTSTDQNGADIPDVGIKVSDEERFPKAEFGRVAQPEILDS